MLNKILLYFLILVSLSFFFIKPIPNSIITASQLFASGLIMLFIFTTWLYGKGKYLNFNFKTEIIVLLVAVGISMFAANIFHDQDFLTSTLAQRSTYFLLFYFFLHSIRIHPGDLIKIMLVFSLLFVIIYLIQFFAYPTRIISSTIMAERGTIRIFLTGGGYAFFIYFFSLSRFFSTRNSKYILLSLIMLSIFVLMGSRQLLGSVVFLTFMFVIFSKQIKSKVAIFIIIALSVIPLLFAFQEVITSMFEVSVLQSEDAEDNVRLKAARFFMVDFFPNSFSYITGNGAPGNNSEYGRQVRYYMENYGFFQSDIGMIGEYSMYGILFLLAELTILFKTLFIKLPDEIKFVKYIFLGVLMMSFTGGGGFSEAETVVNICLLLYLIDAYKMIDRNPKPLENAIKPVNTHTSI